MDLNQKVTTDHGEIKTWAEKNKGAPEIIDHPEAKGDTPSLRLDFPGKNDEVFLSEGINETHVPWDEFFREFDRQDLAFEYMDYENMEDPSSAYHFIKRNAIDV